MKGNVVFVFAMLCFGVSFLMAVSLLTARTAGYHISGLGGWAASACGWFVAAMLADEGKADDRDEPDIFNS